MRNSILVIFLLYPILANGVSALMGFLLYITLWFIRRKRREQEDKEEVTI